MTDQTDKPKAKGGCLKWGLIAVGGVFAVGVIGGVLGEMAPPEPGDSAAVAGVDAAPVQTIDAPAMFALFEQNEVAAKAQFDGKPVRITGTVKAIQLDLLDNPQVQLVAGNDFQYVLLGFDKDASAATGALSKGQEISALCGEVTEVIGNPYATECVIEAP